MMWLLGTVAVSVALGYCGHAVVARRRWERVWSWHFTRRDGGRLVHAIPADGGVHLDEPETHCRCQPFTERFPRPDGGYGEAVYHRRLVRR